MNTKMRPTLGGSIGRFGVSALVGVLAVATWLLACGGGAREQLAAADSAASGAAYGEHPPPRATAPVGTLEIVAELDRMPSGVAVIDGRVFISLPRWVEPGGFTVAEMVNGRPVAYPSAAANEIGSGPGALASVNGLHADSRGRLWMLDNGRVDLGPAAEGSPKIVVWNTSTETEDFRHVFDPSVAPPGASFLNDIVVDEPFGFAYITQSGMGGPPGLIVFEIPRDRAWRALDGARSVSAEPGVEIVIDGETVMLHRPDGPVVWRVAANAITMDADGRHLLFGPMSGRTLFRIPTIVLRDVEVGDEERSAAVEVGFEKPLTDGICAGPDGTVYMTDIEHEALVARRPDGSTANVVSDPRFSFPVACEAPGDGWLYFTTNQLHRMPLLLGGEDRREPPYYVWRVRID